MTALVIRAPNWLGDAVMALPAMEAIREAFPGARVTVAAPPSIAPVFREDTSARADQVLEVPERGREAASLRAGGFETIILLTNSFSTALAARRAGIPNRWGYGPGARRFLLTRSVRRPRGRIHQSEYYVRLVRELGLAAGERRLPRVRPRAATLARADTLLDELGVPRDQPLVGFAPGAAYGHAKRWPPRRMAEVIAGLSREQHASCMLVGVSGDRDAGREIESSLPPDVRVVNLIGRTDLRMLVGLLARCRAFVSNDSGAMHLAAAVGLPVAAIFGPTDERVTAPLGDHDVLVHDVFCRPCMLRDCPIDHRCMKGVTAEAVRKAVVARLTAAAG